jgi:7-cyano-7-deazaguanine synthase
MKTVLIISGGMDSATLAFDLPGGDDLLCLSFDYGQRNRLELGAAAKIAAARGAEHRIINMADFAASCPGCSLTDPTIPTPHCHYADEGTKLTVVPSRNAMMLAAAFGVAVAHGAGQVAIAVHRGDHLIYPDCRPEFIEALEKALNLGVWADEPLRLHAPYITLTKADIARRGLELGVPYGLTWTCYEPRQGADQVWRHCGQCGSCQERKESFRVAGLPDPTEYAV